MSAPQVIFSDKAASPLGPYSQAIKANGLIFCSGQIPCDKSGKLVEGSLADKTRQCIQNLSAVLEEAGSSLAKVTKTTIFLTDLSGFAEVNEEYAKHFPARPARSTIGVKQLPLGVPVEIECIAIA